MAEKSTFGIDAVALAKLDFNLAIQRIRSDVRSDFVLAPHISCIYANCADDLVADVIKLCQSGQFSPSLPITIDVPKKQRLAPIGVKRLQPNFVRPGGILFPRDRLLMQALADAAQPITEEKLDRKICFSHQSADKGFEHRMFRPSRTCWSEMQGQLRELAKKGALTVLRADIASCFQSINQHTLVNILEGAGFPKEFVKPLESMLTQMSAGRSSRGLVQGIYPSDLLGNFYLYPLDRYLSDACIPSIRYVDDIYAFFNSHEDCDRTIKGLYREMRRLDLSLNEAKSSVTTPIALLTSDPDLDEMFEGAIHEIRQMRSEEETEAIVTDYGFQGIWAPEDEESHDIEIKLQATEALFDQIPHYVDSAEEIERFCLPMFAAFGSDYALEHVLAKVETTPSMSQLYFSYLSGFLQDERVLEKLYGVIINRRLLFDWEYLWAIGSIVRMEKAKDQLVSSLLKLCQESIHDSIKAMALIAAAKHGDVDRQKIVVEAIGNFQSTYVRGAILFSTRYMHKAVGKNAIDLLEHTDPMLALIAASVKKQK